MEKHKTCSFFGHRKINETKDLRSELQRVIINLIENEDVKFFYLEARVNLIYFATRL